MANNIDFGSLKARAMGSGTDEEAVTVNTRALIDKVLARYSGEWTVLRELLQNAADASATKVTVRIETIPSTTVPAPSVTDEAGLIKHVISHHTVKRLILRNNGTPFNSNDWARLKRIAEGNPDETKIGAFGVGFYSVFSDCEEPFVSSGKEAIAFYWKGNALFTRRLQLDEADCSSDTAFVLDYRNTTSPVPALMPLCQFLASSLTFVGLESIELWLDNWNLLKLSRKLAPSVTITIPRDISTKTPEGLMRVNHVTREVAQLDATCMKAVAWKSPVTSSRYEGNRKQDTTASLRSFFSRLTGSSTNNDSKSSKPEKSGHISPSEDLSSYTTSCVFLHISTAHIKTSTSASFSAELQRATKKPPPKATTLAILTSSYTAPTSEGPHSQISDNDADIFNGVLPSQSGRIYIGFPTHQTTGLNAHISAPSVIPTVERESIDLNARWVRTWNLELLRAAGIVCRIAWSAEMSSLRNQILSRVKRFERPAPQTEDIASVLPEAIHISNQFVFRESTPTSQVGQVVEDSFWTCSQNAYLEVLSTCGVLPSHKVRTAPKDLSFMDGIPVLPEDLTQGASDFIKRLVEFGLITEVTISDIKRELENNALSSKQLVEFLSWITKKATGGEIDLGTVKALLNVCVANDESEDGSAPGLLILRDMTNFVNPNRIPVDLPMPPFVLPFKYSKGLQQHRLDSIGWQELQVDSWVRWVVENATNRGIFTLEQDITRSAAFAARVLPVLSRQWDGLAPPSKANVIDLFRTHTVIPTKAGMRKPSEAYFPSVRIFDDLPIVTGLNNVKEKFLMSLGVRKTVDINIIFERLLSNPGDGKGESDGRREKWSHVELIKYLTSVRNDIPAVDLAKLRDAKICTAEANTNNGASTQRYQVKQLFEPDDSLRELGFSLIYWPGKYLPRSAEGNFLTSLGLKPFPSAADMIHIMVDAASAKNTRLRDKALTYFIAQHVSNNYAAFDYAKVTTPFLPIEGGGLSNPINCFTAEGASLFGFDLLRRDLHPHASKFGVKQHPSIVECMNILIHKPPATKPQAKALFEYFAGRLTEVTSKSAGRIGQSAIVPISRDARSSSQVFEKAPSVIRHITPQECYLGQGEDYADIFDFVDFGAEANLFLLACGSKREPTNIEIASILVKEPARISAKLQTSEKYLKLLRSIAENMSTIKRDGNLLKNMKKAPFLLASKEVPRKSTARKDEKYNDTLIDDDDEEEGAIKEWQLVRAVDSVIVDDYPSFTLFKESILAAPQEETLEHMYSLLGTPSLSSLVEEHVQRGALVSNQHRAVKLQKQIYERSRLFLHDFSRDMIKHDTRWLENHLSVEVVRYISLRRSLRGRGMSHLEDRSAVVIRRAKDAVLCISESRTDLYQVSQALVHLMLSRPKLHSTLTLEMLLKTDLLELRARGYNVERILRQKAAEARMSATKREQQLEEENRQVQERDKTQEQQLQKPSMPGVFPESLPNTTSGQDSYDSQSGGMFSNLTRQFGLDDYLKQNPIKNALQNTKDILSKDSTPTDNLAPKESGKVKQTGSQITTSPQALQSKLQSAIKSCRPHTSSTLHSQGQTNQLQETKSYCDERPAHDLAFLADSGNGIRIFISKSSSDQEGFLKTHGSGMTYFATMLGDCAKIFNLNLDTISIFYEEAGRAIAFNSGGSIFCNYYYFKQLHLEKTSQGSRAEGLIYWFVILCHELAHNIVSDHGPEHGYYTESLVAEYFQKCVQTQGKN